MVDKWRGDSWHFTSGLKSSNWGKIPQSLTWFSWNYAAYMKFNLWLDVWSLEVAINLYALCGTQRYMFCVTKMSVQVVTLIWSFSLRKGEGFNVQNHVHLCLLSMKSWYELSMRKRQNAYHELQLQLPCLLSHVRLDDKVERTQET